MKTLIKKIIILACFSNFIPTTLPMLQAGLPLSEAQTYAKNIYNSYLENLTTSAAVNAKNAGLTWLQNVLKYKNRSQNNTLDEAFIRKIALDYVILAIKDYFQRQNGFDEEYENEVDKRLFQLFKKDENEFRGVLSSEESLRFFFYEIKKS